MSAQRTDPPQPPAQKGFQKPLSASAVRYGSALLSVGIATIARLLLTRLLGPTAVPFITYFPAVVFSAWMGGLGPGVLSVLLGALAADYFFVPPAFDFGIPHAGDVWSLGIFLCAGLGAAAMGEAQRKAQQRAQASQELFTTTLRSIGDAVIATDMEGRITFLNPVAETLTGWPHAEAQGKPLTEVFVILNEETRQPVESPVARALRAGTVVELANHMVLIGRDGTEYPIEDSAAPIRDERGQMLGVILVFHDITQRKHQEREAHAVMASAHCLIWHSEVWGSSKEDLHWDLKPVNEEALLRLLPLERPPGKSLITAWVESHLPGERARMDAFAIRMVLAGRSYVQEFRCRRADGEIRWMQEDVNVETIAPGHWRVVGITTDITERRRLEEERAYLMSSAQCLLWWADIEEQGDPDYLNWEMHFPDNEAAQRFLPLALSAGEEYRQGFYRWRLEEDRKRCDRLGTAAIRAGQSYQQDFRCRCSDGTIRWLSEDVHVDTLAAGKHWRAVGVCTDITERKQVEAALQASEEQLRATLEQAAVGIAQIGADFHWLQVNQKLCDILGYTREELLARTFQDITHPEDLDLDRALGLRMVAGEILSYSVVKRNLRKDGSVVWINLSVSLVRHPSGEPKYFICVLEDITERKRLENQLLEAQKLESVGRLAGGVAHDFNNLLTAILGYTELATEECEANPIARDYLKNVTHAAERAASLTSQLLAFARRQVIEPKNINLNDLIMNLDKLLRRLIGENIELVILPKDALRAVKVDPGQFEQILVNLVINARDAMPDGGRITIETQNVTLDAEYAQQHEDVLPGEYVLLAVSDTGTGMEEEVRLHIFEPFFTTKEQGRGTGLGLATVYGIVKQAKGHIWLYSELGAGTIFKIYLPGVPAQTETVAITPQIPALMGGSETILLVEDEPLVRALAVQTLRSQGYSVLEAMHGEEALRVASGRETQITLLLTDVVMPRMSGKELADRLQAHHPELKVLFASGYTENTIVHHGVLEPGISFLTKPFSPTELIRKVREVLDTGKNS